MGQVFSNIWSCLCRKHRHDTPNTAHNDHLAQQQDHQSYYITIPDADIHQIPRTIPARFMRAVPRDFTPPVPTLVDFNNYVFQNQQRIVKKKEKEHYRQEVIPPVVEKPARITRTIPHDITPPVPTLVVDFNNYASQNQQRIVKKKLKEHYRQEVIPPVVEKPARITCTIPHDVIPPVPNLVVDYLNNRAFQNKQRIPKKKEKEHQRQEVIPPVVEKQIIVKPEVIKKVPSVSKQKPVKTIGPFTNKQKILLVGEGDFSFSASLAVAFDSASNIIATSLNSHEFLIRNYRQFVTNKMKLKSRGATVIHEIDATAMAKDHVLGRVKFDRINYNFPHTGTFGCTNSDLRINQELIRGFLRNAKTMINEDGEILITHKCNYFFEKWGITKLGSDEGLHLIEAVIFNQTIYPGYNTKYGFGGDKNFDCNPSKTYIFGLLPKSIRRTWSAVFSEPEY